MATTVSYIAKIERQTPENGGGWLVSFPDLENHVDERRGMFNQHKIGVTTDGETFEEAKEKAYDALEASLFAYWCSEKMDCELGRRTEPSFPEARFQAKENTENVKYEKITVKIRDYRE